MIRPGKRAPHKIPAAKPRGWASVNSRTRIVVMLLGGAAAIAVTGIAGFWGYAPLVGWDVAALIFNVWVWIATGPMQDSATASHATREDPGHVLSDLIIVVASIASLAAVGFVLVRAATLKGSEQDLLAGLGLASVTLSWLAVHTLFMLRYARLYYTEPAGGVNFNQDAPPRYLDFAYLSFTLGMTFQVSDTDLQNPAIRHTALRHALISYLFGAVVLATTINLIAGLGTGGGH